MSSGFEINLEEGCFEIVVKNGLEDIEAILFYWKYVLEDGVIFHRGLVVFKDDISGMEYAQKSFEEKPFHL